MLSHAPISVTHCPHALGLSPKDFFCIYYSSSPSTSLGFSKLRICKPSKPLPQKEQSLFLGWNCYTMFWKEWKINFPFHAIFRLWEFEQFLVFSSEMGKIISIRLEKLKSWAMFWNGFWNSWGFFVRFLIFDVWSILYFNFVMHWRLATNSEIFKTYFFCG